MAADAAYISNIMRPKAGACFPRISSAILLKSPMEVLGDWEYVWFDAAHSHSLLLNEGYFYILNFEETNPQPKMYYHEVGLPAKLMLGKVSLDRKLIAVQCSLSSIIVLDTATKRRWDVEIKSPHDSNYILPFGIVWSDHGGNSQDLIIVTSRGLELYKISELRGQCKLSRFVAQPAATFWYDSVSRVMLLGSPRKLGAASTPYSSNSVLAKMGTQLKEVLLMDAYFFKTEKSGMPMLELPPPDKVPRFELGPGVKPEDVALLTLYGAALCMVRYSDNSVGSDFIAVYQLTRQRVQRIHYLALGMKVVAGIRFSCCDNLLLCHCLNETVSLLFDIQSPPVKTGSGAAIQVILPIIEGQCMHYAHAPAKKGAPAGATAGAVSDGSGNAIDRSNIAVSSEMNLGTADASAIISSTIAAVAVDGADTATSDELSSNPAADWDTPIDSVPESSRIFEWRMRSGSNAAAADLSSFDTLTFLGELNDASPAASSSPGGLHSSGGGGSRGGSGIYWSSRYSSNNSNSNNNSTLQLLQEMLEEAQPAQAVYNCSNRNGGVFEFLSPCWLVDTSDNIMWRIDCDCSVIVRSIVDHRLRIQFLGRRGVRYRPQKDHGAVKRCIEYQFVSIHGRLAKHLIMRNFYEALLHQIPQIQLEDLFSAIMRPYISEFRRLTGSSVATEEDIAATAAAAATGGNSMRVSASPDSWSQRSQRSNSTTYSEGIFGRGGFKLARMSINAANAFSLTNTLNAAVRSAQSEMDGTYSSQDDSAALEALCFLDDDPLEPDGCLQMFQPDISMVGIRIRKLQYLSVRNDDGAIASSTTDGLQLQNPNNIQGSSQTKISSSGTAATVGAGGGVAIKQSSYRIKPACQSMPVTTRRDQLGYLITTQNELLSHIWIPLLLNSDVDVDYCADALLLFILLLRENDVPVLEPLVILLMQALFHRHRYVELCHYVRMGFIPDGREVALTALEFVNMLYSHNQHAVRSASSSSGSGDGTENIGSESSDNNVGSSHSKHGSSSSGRDTGECSMMCVAVEMKESARAVLQQFALDMLFRLDEAAVIVKWYLNHGMILTAIDVCRNSSRRVPGQWRSGLFPGCIAAIDFFQCAVQALEISFQSFQDNVKHLSTSLPISDTASNGTADTSNTTSAAATAGAHEEQLNIDAQQAGTPAEIAAAVEENAENAELVAALRKKRVLLQEQNAEIMFAVYVFIRDWDCAAVSTCFDRGQSKLASQVLFPAHLFTERATANLMYLFGYA